MLARDDVVALRLPERREVIGRLFVPKGNRTGMVVVRFKTAPPPQQDDGKAVFGGRNGGTTSGFWPVICRARHGSVTRPAKPTRSWRRTRCAAGLPVTGGERPAWNRPSTSSAATAPWPRTFSSTGRCPRSSGWGRGVERASRRRVSKESLWRRWIGRPASRGRCAGTRSPGNEYSRRSVCALSFRTENRGSPSGRDQRRRDPLTPPGRNPFGKPARPAALRAPARRLARRPGAVRGPGHDQEFGHHWIGPRPAQRHRPGHPDRNRIAE